MYLEKDETLLTGLRDPAEKTASTANITKPQLKSSNQKYIVPFGILTVLFTLYLTTSAFKRTLELNQTKLGDEIKQLKDLESIREELRLKDEEREKEIYRRKSISDRLLEHHLKCFDLEIFTRNIYEYEMVSENIDGKLLTEKSESEDTELNESKESTVLKGHNNGKANKRLNGKNFSTQKYNNKSLKAKSMRKRITQKKEVIPQKKGSTAEPIIYMFALVFIYLLLKAASDINQHYKSQSKGDKRLRRCSLQSYAQTHKPDRRASKESPTHMKHQMLVARSKSVDRYTCADQLARTNDILIKLRKYTSVDGQQQLQQQRRGTATWNYITASNSPLMTPTSECVKTITARSLAISRQDSITASPSGSSNRRCSVPVSLNYQRMKLTTTPAVPMSATTRRTSIASSSNFVAPGSMESLDFPFPEVKRRVRMINRH